MLLAIPEKNPGVWGRAPICDNFGETEIGLCWEATWLRDSRNQCVEVKRNTRTCPETGTSSIVTTFPRLYRKQLPQLACALSIEMQLDHHPRSSSLQSDFHFVSGSETGSDYALLHMTESADRSKMKPWEILTEVISQFTGDIHAALARTIRQVEGWQLPPTAVETSDDESLVSPLQIVDAFVAETSNRAPLRWLAANLGIRFVLDFHDKRFADESIKHFEWFETVRMLMRLKTHILDAYQYDHQDIDESESELMKRFTCRETVAIVFEWSRVYSFIEGQILHWENYPGERTRLPGADFSGDSCLLGFSIVTGKSALEYGRTFHGTSYGRVPSPGSNESHVVNENEGAFRFSKPLKHTDLRNGIECQIRESMAIPADESRRFLHGIDMFRKWLNPRAPETSPLQAVLSIIQCTHNLTPLEWLSDRHGGMIIADTPSPLHDESLLPSWEGCFAELADVESTITKSILTPGPISADELVNIRTEWEEAKQWMAHFIVPMERYYSAQPDQATPRVLD